VPAETAVVLEGELRLRLHLGDGCIEDLSVASTRPDVARTLLQGRRRTEVQAAVPLLFSLCGRSQATACALACAAAAGEAVGPAQIEASRAAVAAELVRETAWHMLLNVPKALGDEPAPQDVAAARGALAYRWGLPPHDPVVHDLAIALWGCPAAEWLQLQSWRALRDWAAAGRTATARGLQQALLAETAGPAPATTALLAVPDDTGLRALAAVMRSDEGFCRQPRWQGAPAETGALARLQHDALLADADRRPATRLPLRWVARLRELALLLAHRSAPGVSALSLGDGQGLAWVDNARGLLIHQVALDGEQVRRYAIVAPTEWNFHPQGALRDGLLGAAVADAASARALAEALVQSLDPCVSCRVELDIGD
jgi:hypothetical protein